ncbi:MAG: hypothetical protein KJ899_02660, partial [Gammaproteobacteria bacterium]|nr:hypothetical protein [Gammaproteobacteria bacterium]
TAQCPLDIAHYRAEIFPTDSVFRDIARLTPLAPLSFSVQRGREKTFRLRYLFTLPFYPSLID